MEGLKELNLKLEGHVFDRIVEGLVIKKISNNFSNLSIVDVLAIEIVKTIKAGKSDLHLGSPEEE